MRIVGKARPRPLLIAALLLLGLLPAPAPTSAAPGEQGRDIQGRDIQGRDIQGRDIQGRDIQGRDIQGRDIQGRDIQGRDIQGRDIQGRDIQGRDIQGRDIQGRDIQGTEVQGRDIQGRDIQGRDIQGRDIQGRDIQGRDIQGQGIDRQGAVTRVAEVKGIRLHKEQLRGLDLNRPHPPGGMLVISQPVTDAQIQATQLQASASDTADGSFIFVPAAPGVAMDVRNTFWEMPLADQDGTSLGHLLLYVADVEQDRMQNASAIHRNNDDVWLYTVYYLNPLTYQWLSLCPMDKFGKPHALAMPVNPLDREASRRNLTFACTASGVAAKCARNWGYKPWRQPAAGIDWKALYGGCLAAARADYCQDDRSFTRNGTLVDLFDGKVVLSDGWAYAPGSTGTMLHEEYQISVERSVRTLIGEPAYSQLPDDATRELVTRLKGSGLQSSRYGDLDPGRSDASALGQRCQAAPFINRCAPHEPYACYRANNQADNFGALVAINSPRHCAHSDAEVGEPLDPLCNACVTRVCSVRPGCCGDRAGANVADSLVWDKTCVELRDQVCRSQPPDPDLTKARQQVWLPGVSALPPVGSARVFRGGIIGSFEGFAAGNVIEGWACDPGQPQASVPIQVALDQPLWTPGTRVLAATVADQPLRRGWRELVAQECSGDPNAPGRHGFRITLDEAQAGGPIADRPIFVYGYDVSPSASPLARLRGGSKRTPAAGADSPTVTLPENNVSVLWTGWVEPETPGNYRFVPETTGGGPVDAGAGPDAAAPSDAGAPATGDDDEYRVWVNGWLVAKRWDATDTETVRPHVYLLRGVRYHVRVEYRSGTGAPKFKLEWADDAAGQRPIPTTALYPLAQGSGTGAEITYFADPLDVADREKPGESIASVEGECQPGAAVDCLWQKTPAPDGQPDPTYGVRVRGQVVPPVTGKYLFRAESDGATEIFVDGRLVGSGATHPRPDDATCAHDVCEVGGALNRACGGQGGCAGFVCLLDPYCCALTWDSTCVGRVQQACGFSCTPPPAEIELRAGVKYDVEVRYRHAESTAGKLRLLWATPGSAADTIPAHRFFKHGDALVLGTGINASYFSDRDFKLRLLDRTDPGVEVDPAENPGHSPTVALVCLTGGADCGQVDERLARPLVSSPPAGVHVGERVTFTGGGLAAGGHIRVLEGGVILADQAGQPDGTFSVDVDLSPGKHNLRFQQAHLGLGTQLWSEATACSDTDRCFELDVFAAGVPGPPTVASGAVAAVSGERVEVKGTGTAGATVTATGPGGSVTATVGSDGRYTLVVPLPVGTHQVTLTQTLSGSTVAGPGTTVDLSREVPQVVLLEHTLGAPGSDVCNQGNPRTVPLTVRGTASTLPELGKVKVADGDGRHFGAGAYFMEIAQLDVNPTTGEFNGTVNLDYGRHLLKFFQSATTGTGPNQKTLDGSYPTPLEVLVKPPAALAITQIGPSGVAYVVDTPAFVAGSSCLTRRGLRNTALLYEGGVQKRRAPIADGGRFEMPAVELTPGCQELTVSEAALSLSGAGEVLSDRMAPSIQIAVRPPPPVIGSPVNGDQIPVLSATVTGTRRPDARVTIYRDVPVGADPDSLPAFAVAELPVDGTASFAFTVSFPSPGHYVLQARQTIDCQQAANAESHLSAPVSLAVGDMTPPTVQVTQPRQQPAPGGALVTYTVQVSDDGGPLTCTRSDPVPPGASSRFECPPVDGDSETVTVTCTPAFNSLFLLGVTDVSCEAREGPNGPPGFGTLRVFVTDPRGPRIHAPDIEVEAQGPAGAAVNYQVTATGWVANCAPPGSTELRPCARWGPVDQGLGFVPRAIAVLPADTAANPDTLFVATSETLGPSRLLRSIDSGQTWEVRSALSAGWTPRDLVVLAGADPDTHRLFLGTSRGVLKSTDSGRNFTISSEGLDCRDLMVDAAGTLYAAAANGVHRATNGGTDWSSLGLEGRSVISLAADPRRAGRLYAGVGSFEGSVQATGPQHVVFFKDAATTWRLLDTPANALTVAIPPRFLEVSPRDSTLYTPVIKFTFDTGVLTNATFWSTTELALSEAAAEVGSVAFGAEGTVAQDAVYAGARGVMQRTGGSWPEINKDMWIARPTRLLVGGGSRLYALGSSGLYRSEQTTNETSSRQWHRVKPVRQGGSSGEMLPVGDYSLTAVLPDPTTPDRAYAATTAGLFKTTNAGTTWFAQGTGLVDLEASPGGGLLRRGDEGFVGIRDLAMDAGSADVLYASSGPRLLFLSNRNGDEWAHIQGPALPMGAGAAMAADPFVPGRVYIADDLGKVWRRERPVGVALGVDRAFIQFGEVARGNTRLARVQVRNQGAALVNITQVGLENGTDFIIAAHTCAAIPPGQACEVHVAYRPISGSALHASAVLRVTGLIPGGQSVSVHTALAGRAGNPFTTDRDRLTFTAPVGGTGTSQTLTVTNHSDLPAGPAFVSVINPRFVLELNSCVAGLPPGQSCAIVVRFIAQDTQPQVGSLRLQTSPSDPALVVELLGQALAPARIQFVDQSDRNFGTVAPGQTTPPLSFRIRNVGDLPALGPFTVARAGVNPLAFISDGTNCPGSLAPGHTCDAFIRFAAPMTPGTTSAVATVTAATGGTTGLVNLSGESLAPGLAISPAVHDFGDVSVSGPAPSATLTVTNLGAAAIATQGPFATGAGFLVTGSTCGGPMLPGSSCTITVSAQIAVAGVPFTGTVAVFAGVNTVVASLAARTRAAVARLEPVVGGLDFGTIGVGQGSRPRRMDISNVGNEPFEPLVCQVLGGGAASFRLVANSCAGQALAPGARCGVDLVFAPDSPGPKSATFECGVPGVAVTGVGLAPANVTIDLGPTTFAGQQPTGTESFPLMFRIVASGPAETRTTPLTLALGGDNADDFRLEPAGCGAARTEGLPAGQACVGFIFFAPQSAGDRRALFTNGAVGAGSSVRTLTGTAVGPSTAALWVVSAGSVPPPAGPTIAGVESLLVLPSEPRLIATRFLLGGGADTYFYREGVSTYRSLGSGPNHVLAGTTAEPLAFYGKPQGGPPTALQRRDDLGATGTWQLLRTAPATGHPREGNFARLVTDPALEGPVLYTLGTGGQLWTSADGGGNWQRFEPQPPDVAFAQLWLSPADGSLYAQAVPAAAFPGPHVQDATASDQGPWAIPGRTDLAGGRLWRHNPTGPLPAGARVVEGDLRPTCTGGPAGSHRGAVFPLDPPVTEIACTATDAFQTPATARFRVTVTDRTPPAVTVPPDVVLDGAAPVAVVYSPPPSAEDLVDGPMTPDCVDAVTGAPRVSGSQFQGSTAVICRATDNHGNTGQASFKVTVGAAANVTLTVPADHTGPDAVAAQDAGGADFVYPTSATVSDGSPASITCTPAGTHFPLGITTVSCVATGAGAADAKSFRIEVRDRTAPEVRIPDDKKQLQAVATSPLGAEVDFDLPTASDNVDALVSVACSPGAGLYPIGTTEVACSAVDRAGNVGSNTFQITVSDLSPPTLTLPADIRSEADSRFGKRVSYAVSASDRETPGLLPTCVPASGALFPLNTTVTVTCIARDSAANQVSGSFRVTVFDGEPSVTVPQAPVLAEATGPEGAQVRFTAEAFDSIDGTILPACTRTAVSGSDLPVAVAPGTDYQYPLGLSEVTCQGTDSSGNQASASFVVEVRDTTPPALTFTTNTVRANAQSAAGAVVDFTQVVTARDIVNGDGLPIDCKPASGTTFPLGLTRVTCRARDQANNIVEGQLTVEVVDGTAPVVRVPADITVPADGPAGAVVHFADKVSAIDEVEGILDATCTPPSGATFPVGVTPVACTATDKQNHTGSASFRVTVLAPPSGNRAPVITEVSGPKDPVEVGSTVKLSATFTDADTADRHTCSIRWEDGTVKTGTVTESKGTGTCRAERKLNTTGVLATTVTITDNPGLAASARHEFTVVYKDTGRFVVAAGTVASPAGALRAQPTVAGTARFGLLAPFRAGARTPSAGARLRFSFADLQMDAGDFQRMFIQDHTAVYLGQGTVNGTAGLAFAAAVREGRRSEPDRFGIVIWNPGSGALIYSNLPNGARDLDPDRLPPLATGEVIIED